MPAGTALADLTGCALMGTVVHAGSAARGRRGHRRRAPSSGRSPPAWPRTSSTPQFQVGLRRFSMLLVYVAGALTAVDLRRSTWCCTGRSSTRCCSRWRSRSGSPRSCCPRWSPPAWPPGRAGWPAQGPGQTAGLHRGPRRRRRAVHRQDRHPDRGRRSASCAPCRRPARSPDERCGWGCSAPRPPPRRQAVGGNPLDRRCGTSPAAATQRTALAGTPRSACCRSTTSGGWSPSWSATRTAPQTLVTKGAPESVLARCVDVPPGRAHGAGRRSSPPATGSSPSPPAGRRLHSRRPPPTSTDLTLVGFPGLPRPAQARRRRGLRAPGRPRHHRQDRHRRQRRGRDARSAATSAWLTATR